MRCCGTWIPSGHYWPGRGIGTRGECAAIEKTDMPIEATGSRSSIAKRAERAGRQAQEDARRKARGGLSSEREARARNAVLIRPATTPAFKHSQGSVITSARALWAEEARGEERARARREQHLQAAASHLFFSVSMRRQRVVFCQWWIGLACGRETRYGKGGERLCWHGEGKGGKR